MTIEAGRTTNVKVVAAPAGQIALRIDPPEARARRIRVEAAGRELDITALDFDPRGRAAAADDGRPVLYLTRQALAPGTYTLTVRVDGYAPATVRAEVLADRLVDATVELQPR